MSPHVCHMGGGKEMPETGPGRTNVVETFMAIHRVHSKIQLGKVLLSFSRRWLQKYKKKTVDFT